MPSYLIQIALVIVSLLSLSLSLFFLLQLFFRLFVRYVYLPRDGWHKESMNIKVGVKNAQFQTANYFSSFQCTYFVPKRSRFCSNWSSLLPECLLLSISFFLSFFLCIFLCQLSNSLIIFDLLFVTYYFLHHCRLLSPIFLSVPLIYWVFLYCFLYSN